MPKYHNVAEYLQENNIYLFEDEIFDEINSICESSYVSSRFKHEVGHTASKATGIYGGAELGRKLANKMKMGRKASLTTQAVGAVAGAITGGALYKKLVMKGKSHSQAADAAAALETKKGNHEAAKKLKARAQNYRDMGK